MAPRRIVSPPENKNEEEPAQEFEAKEVKEIKEVTTEELINVLRAYDQRITNLEATNTRMRGAL